MDTGHITQLARDQLGKDSRCVYRRDFTRPEGEEGVKVDAFGAGDMQEWFDQGTDAKYEQTPDGLFLAVNRKPGATSQNKGVFASLSTAAHHLPNQVLLVANYRQPSLEPAGAGTYAAMIMFQTAKVSGVTCQFKKEGVVQLNLPKLDVVPAQPARPLDEALVARILDPRHPSIFTVAVALEWKAGAAEGRAFVFVGDTRAASIPTTDPTFRVTNWKSMEEIQAVRAGLATATEGAYRATMMLLGFEIWAPHGSKQG